MAVKKPIEPVNLGEVVAPLEAVKPIAQIKVGDMVNIRNYPIKKGRVVELRGPLAPGGGQVYRIRVRRRPKAVYIELREDQISLIPASE